MKEKFRKILAQMYVFHCLALLSVLLLRLFVDHLTEISFYFQEIISAIENFFWLEDLKISSKNSITAYYQNVLSRLKGENEFLIYHYLLDNATHRKVLLEFQPEILIIPYLDVWVLDPKIYFQLGYDLFTSCFMPKASNFQLAGEIVKNLSFGEISVNLTLDVNDVIPPIELFYAKKAFIEEIFRLKIASYITYLHYTETLDLALEKLLR